VYRKTPLLDLGFEVLTAAEPGDWDE